MRKNGISARQATQERVLARVLAEDLRRINGGNTNDPPAKTVEVTNNNTDITNVGGDGD